jgi:predicted nucleotidyltransferase
MANTSVVRRFTEALDRLIEQVKRDRSVLAAILCGSLSHDTVWEKSDIDLVLITVDDKKVPPGDLALYADGVNVHAWLLPRTDFRKTVEGSIRNSFVHSLLTKGRLLYTHDETVADLCAGLREIGERDRQIQLLNAGSGAVATLDKAHKWFITRGDLDYSSLWILYTATSIAKIEVIGAGLLAEREVIPQAMKLNPELFKRIYTDLLNAKKTPASVRTALTTIDSYLADRAQRLFGCIVEYLREAGEPRSCSDIEHYFKNNFGVEGVTTACEYLAHRGLLGKASTPVHLTKKSNIEVQELAFFYAES